MIDRIVEVFTKPKMEITMIDELIQAGVILTFVAIIVLIYLLIKTFSNK